MSSETQQVQESPLVQGVDEKLTYTLTVTPWGNDPVNPLVKAFDITDGGYIDVSNTVLVGSPTISENVITLPSLENLTAGHKYRIEVQWQSGGNTFECYAEVEAEL